MKTKSITILSKYGLRIIGLTLAVTLVGGCNTISNYDPIAYKQANDLKVDTTTLMDKATGSFSDHSKDIDNLVLEIHKAVDYDAGRTRNAITMDEWNLFLGRNGELQSRGAPQGKCVVNQDANQPCGNLNRFLAHWKQEGKLSSAYIEDKKGTITREFGDITQLEQGKNKSTSQQ